MEEESSSLAAVTLVGVMGRRIAAQFKRAYPKNFNAYRQTCNRREVQQAGG